MRHAKFRAMGMKMLDVFVATDSASNPAREYGTVLCTSWYSPGNSTYVILANEFMSRKSVYIRTYVPNLVCQTQI